ncbi:MAG: antibiotic biosynthesis monooxygenase [Halioglobus sp.]|nr:antibiotic biosynthesis monooxygenase [Halioglobus sp.]
MFAVIFRAAINELDDDYEATAANLRDLAMAQYGCVDFVSHSDGEHEIAISYWQSEAAITSWRADPVHREAQQRGKEQWYKGYSVEVVRIERAYTSDNS